MCLAYVRSTEWLLAVMKSAGWLPNHVRALAALWPLGFADPRSDRFVITAQLLLRHPPAGVNPERGRRSRGRCRVNFFARHHCPSDARCYVGERERRDLRRLALQELRQTRLPICVLRVIRITAVAALT